MASLQTSSNVRSSSSSSWSRKGRIVRATINVQRRLTNISLPGLQTKGMAEEHDLHNCTDRKRSPIDVNMFKRSDNNGHDPLVMAKLYAILEAVADRVEMHKNIGEQRKNWDSLLLTSINALTLSAAAMAGIAATSVIGGAAPVAALKLSSTIMYLSAIGMLSIMNKIQPSQLAEEQRNATRLLKQLHNQIQTIIAMGNPTTSDVKEMMEKVLALDKAYPLPLLGAMLEKFPENVEPAVWWPEQR
ncbi:probable F-box At4g22030 [Olea europaea subsp. europaea]|uniref:Probable F-box At4g22030 n=1 Tax=Olea europaea subsp. europaea TaxID=158383 RepID=A0A8S0PL63_OLEEU|nr:probable F-box At4g22030 [Olea europaea subsp. europaea]